MCKTILLAAGLFTAICLYGQENENGFIFRLDGNYNETATSNALQYVNAYNAESRNGNVSVSAGYLYQHWRVGLGFEYNRSKSTILGELVEERPIAVSETGLSVMSSIFLEQNAVRLNSYGGLFSVNRYLPVWRNLYFTPGFYLGYGRITGNYTGTVVLYQGLLSPIPGILYDLSDMQNYAGSYEQDISQSYFYMQLSPELTWFFSKHFALNIQMGGAGIDVIDFEWSNSSKQINFNPSFWKLGIVFKI